MSVLDIFKTDAFSVISLTDAINKLPFIPGRVGQIVDWMERGVETTTIMVEEVNGVLRLIDPTPRGGPGKTTPKNYRDGIPLKIPHYQIDDAVYADEVQNVRAFGTDSQLETVKGKINMRMQEHAQLEMDPTLEYQRVGAVKGIILNGDGSTLYNLFTVFNVTQPTEVAFDLTAASPASGAVRRKAAGVVRTIAAALGGLTLRTVYGLAGDAFWDDLIANKEVRETYLNQADAAQLREGSVYQTLNYGGITFENYRGAVGATAFIDTDKCNFFPVGVPGLFRTIYAPADYVETVNTTGLPRYAKQFPMQNDKGISLEMQMNALSYCTRPGVLVQGKRGA
jgi:hypothetical protein